MRCDHLWFCYAPTRGRFGRLNGYDNVSEVKIECKAYKTHHHNGLVRFNSVIKRCGVHVECMCCPHQRLGDTQHPFFPIRLNPGDSMGTLGYHISSGATNSIETTNNEFDSTLKGFHGDGCDLSLLPHAYPMGSQDYQPPTVHISLPSSEGLDLPALAFGSTVSEGFDLGSCSMPHNDDSDFNLYPPSKKMRTP